MNKTGIASASKHYQAGDIQPIDLIVSQRMDFLSGSCLKYLCRFKYKGVPEQDLRKAKQYLQWIFEQEGFEWDESTH